MIDEHQSKLHWVDSRHIDIFNQQKVDKLPEIVLGASMNNHNSNKMIPLLPMMANANRNNPSSSSLNVRGFEY